MNPIKFDRNAIHMHRICIKFMACNPQFRANCSGHFCWSFYGSPSPFKNHRAGRNLVFLSGNHAEAWAHGGGSIYIYIYIYIFIYVFIYLFIYSFFLFIYRHVNTLASRAPVQEVL